MKKTTLKSLAWLMMCLCALTFTACGGDDDDEKKEHGTNGGTPSNPNEELAVNIQNLTGTWQAISAKGTGSEGEIINTKTLGGLDSLAVPVLMIINADMTFSSFNPRWEYPHSPDDNWPVFTWKKGDNKLPKGDGTVLLVGKQLQLIDSYDSDYSLSMSIQRLTSMQMVIRYFFDGEDCTVTYGRDGDGADYFSNNSSGNDTDSPSVTPGTFALSDLYGTWEVSHTSGHRYEISKQTGDTKETDSWDEYVPAGNYRSVFNADGTWKSMEYSQSNGTWHEEGSGTFYMRGNELVVTGIEQFSIYSYTKNELIVEYTTQEDKGSVIVQKRYHDTLLRIN